MLAEYELIERPSSDLAALHHQGFVLAQVEQLPLRSVPRTGARHLRSQLLHLLKRSQDQLLVGQRTLNFLLAAPPVQAVRHLDVAVFLWGLLGRRGGLFRLGWLWKLEFGLLGLVVGSCCLVGLDKPIGIGFGLFGWLGMFLGGLGVVFRLPGRLHRLSLLLPLLPVLPLGGLLLLEYLLVEEDVGVLPHGGLGSALRDVAVVHLHRATATLNQLSPTRTKA